VDLSADTVIHAERTGRLRLAWRALADAAGGERDRWLLWLPVAVAAGVLVYFSLSWEPSLWIAPVGLALASVVAVLGFHRSSLVVAMAAAIAAASIGFGLAKLRTIAAAAPVLESRVGPATVSGVVVAVEPWQNGARVILAQPHISRIAPDKTPERVRIRLTRHTPTPVIGQTVKLRAMLMPPTPPALPGAYDFGRQAFFQGIGGVGYAVSRARVVEAAPADLGLAADFRVWIEGLRQSMNRAVMTLLPGASGAMSAALITGDQSAIPADVMDAMRDAGLAHLLAISGFNVALVASVLFFGTRLLLVVVGTAPIWGAANGWALRQPIKKWAAVLTVFGILAYTLITGASVPTQRAFLMTAVVLAAILIDRTAISMRLVMWAALVLMVIAPESLLGASFQMSFAAVIALIAAYESSRRWVRAQRAKGGWIRKATLYLAGMVLTTLVAAAATAPFAAYHFNRLAIYQLVANFAAVPLTAIWIMPWATLVYFLMPFGLQDWALVPMSWGVDALIWLAQSVTAWPNAVMLLPSMPSAGLALITLGGLWLCLWRRSWRFAGLLPIAIGCATMLTVRAPDVLVAAEGGLFAVRGGDGDLLFADHKGQAFVREVWQRRAGAGAGETDEAKETSLHCDSLGCIYRNRGRVVAFIRESAALAEDCAVADAVISWTPIRADRCRGPDIKIDRRALAKGGGHALWLTREGPLRVEAVAESRGERPWSGLH
jgi:competence protein ComEC